MMTRAEYIAENLLKYEADVLNILKCPYGQDVSFCIKLGDCTKCKMQWLRGKFDENNSGKPKKHFKT